MSNSMRGGAAAAAETLGCGSRRRLERVDQVLSIAEQVLQLLALLMKLLLELRGRQGVQRALKHAEPAARTR